MSKKRMRDREVVAGIGFLQFVLIIIVIVIVELWVQSLMLFMTPIQIFLMLLVSLALLTILAGWSRKR